MSVPAGRDDPSDGTRGGDPFAGFWMGGYEGADHVNGNGVALDMAQASGHLDRMDEDHRRAAQAGLCAVRESIGWRLAEGAGGQIDLSRAVAIAQSARRHGLQVLWTLMHYGVPADLSLHDDSLIPRLARFAAEVARVIGPLCTRPPVFTPINEVSFIAWAASLPAMLQPPNNTPGGGDESSRISGYAAKRRLVRASLAAMAAMRQVEPRSRFLHVDPVVHVVAPRDRPDLAPLAQEVAGWQWQAWDMISGLAEPELGGSPQALDLVGVNHYHSSQWEIGSERRLDWHGRDPRRRPLSALLADTWQRYRRPLVLAETSHVGAGRSAWLGDIADQVRRARRADVPVLGICVYPLVDRPDWADLHRWHRSGLFHVSGAAPDPARSAAGAATALSRWPEADCLRSLRAWQRVLPAESTPLPPARRPVLMAFSHLRWGFVQHRARHLLSRLARHWHVIVVEEPIVSADSEPPRLDVVTDWPGIDIVVPHTPLASPGFCEAQRPLLQSLLQAWLTERDVHGAVAWLTTPMAATLARSLNPSFTVYDCSDELAAFLGAPPDLRQREAELLATADLVLAAGPSLAAPRAAAAAERLRVVRNGVDAAHFRRRAVDGSGTGQGTGLSWDGDEAWALQGRLAVPRLGFAGVIDERFDLSLLALLADARPQWQFVMVGPVVKIDSGLLPRRANIHWLGAQPYRLLPALMAGWQVALLPFLLNAATVSANPLKVLEYLAAGLPVVATQVPDLAVWAKGGVSLTRDVDRFLQACEQALEQTPAQSQAVRKTARRLLRGHDWADRADEVHRLLSEKFKSHNT